MTTTRKATIATTAAAVLVAAAIAVTVSLVATTSETGQPGPAAVVIPPPPNTFDLTGTFVLNGTSGRLMGNDAKCEGSRGYDDIRDGASVTVYDATGRVIASGELRDSVYSGPSRCRFAIYVAKVPKTGDFYQIEVSHRGKITIDDVTARTGTTALSLGS
jgi:hypothetical protein